MGGLKLFEVIGWKVYMGGLNLFQVTGWKV